MAGDLPGKVVEINARPGNLASYTRGTLRGESNFGVEEVWRLREPLEEMAQIKKESEQARTLMPEISGQLDEYKTQLGELQSILDSLRVTLLARQASLMAGRAQIDAASQWIAAFHATR
jgi:hypothetical protein